MVRGCNILCQPVPKLNICGTVYKHTLRSFLFKCFQEGKALGSCNPGRDEQLAICSSPRISRPKCVEQAVPTPQNKGSLHEGQI